MSKSLLISLIISVLFIIPLVPAGTEGEFNEDILDLTPHWKDFSRDGNRNGVDDLIDERTDDDINIFVVYDHHPTDRDIEVLESLDLEIFYCAKYVDCIIVNHVTRDQINVIRFLKGVTMVELSPELKPLLDVSTKTVKARPTDLAGDGIKYNDVWEELGFDGTGINIAVLDTGIDNQVHDSLNDLDDNPLTYDPKFIGGWWGVGGRWVDPEDGGATSHGTHCANIALGTGAPDDYTGVAPGARLLDVKVMSDVGVGGIPLPAIEWCIANNDTDWDNDGPANDGIDIMSMSIGGADSNGDDQISLAVNDAADAGIVVVAAMGNGQGRNVNTPAAADGAIAVAGSDDHNTVNRDDDTFGGYSNYGPRTDGVLKPDITAPGAGIMSAIKHTGGLIWMAMTGTSQATPHVAGVVALMLQANPDLTPAQVKNLLRLSAEERGNDHIDPSEPKYDTHWGWGYLDAYEAVIMALGLPDLTVSSIEVDPLKINENDQMRILADIDEHNDRDVEADIEFHDETDGVLISTVHISVPALGRESVSSGFFTAKGGDRTFKVLITNAVPDEEDTANNQMVYSMHVNYRPEARIDANRTDAKTYEDISFDGSNSSDRDGTVKWYHFDFGDGESTDWQEEATTEHSYEDGTVDYTVTLMVKDNQDAESLDGSKWLITIDNRPPTAGAGSDRSATEGEEVEFSGTGEDRDGTIDKYEWDFDGDGKYDWESSENGETTHTYEEEGNYTAVLRVTDDDNATATDDREIEVLPAGTPNYPPEARIDSPEEGEVYQLEDEITFDGRQSWDPDGDSLLYSWTDNGREFSTEKYFKSSLEAGEHRIDLQVDDQRGGVDTETVNIRVNSPPVAGIKSPEDEGTYYTNEDIEFDASDSSDPDDDTLSYTWEVDGEYLSDMKTFTERLDEGAHEITLTVDDGNGADDSITITIHLEKPVNHDPIAVISWPEEGSEFRDVDEILFDASNSTDPDDDPIVNYEWYNNSIKMSDKMRFSEKLALGDYMIKLIVRDDKEGKGEAVVNISVVENRKPKALITLPEDGAAYSEGNAIDFDGSNSKDDDGDELTYEWKDDDEVISNEVKFSRTLDPGQHIITLTVNDGQRSDDIQITIRVNQKPNAVISSPLEGHVFFSDEVVTFDARSSTDPDGKIVSYIWEDNDERIGAGITMERVLDTGDHDITLRIKDDDGAFSTATVSVKAVDHSIAFSVQEEYVEVEAGKEGEFHLKVHNLAEKTDHIQLSADEAVEFSEDSFTLDPNIQKTVTMAVTVNYDTFIHLTAWAGQFQFYTTATVRIAQEYGVSMQVSKNALTGLPGTNLNYILVVKNEGSDPDTITLTYLASKSWNVDLNHLSLDILSEASKEVIVKVSIPESAVKGETMVLDITAMCKDGETSAQISLTTTVTVSDVPVKPQKSDDSPGFEFVVLVVALLGASGVSYFTRKWKH